MWQKNFLEVFDFLSKVKLMKISPIYSNFISVQASKQDSSNFENPAFVYNKIFSFKGSQLKPLTDDDYNNAKNNLDKNVQKIRKEEQVRSYEKILLNDLDLDKINGLQKDIKVFEGLTMKEIAFVLHDTSLLLNRGCHNHCAHCAFSATPITNKTYDRMSYEDFKLFVDGVKELQDRAGDEINVMPEIHTFYDSDCIDIEIKDKDGKVYDYIDCVDYMQQKGFPEVLLDTSGWNPNSTKLQKRAEKFIDYVVNMPDSKAVKMNLSLNPYHILVTESMKAKENGDEEKAEFLENKYVERMANALFTYTPLLDSNVDFEIISRAIDNYNCVNSCNFDKLIDLQKKISIKLKSLYVDDLNTKKKYVKSERDISYFINKYSRIMYESVLDGYPEVIPMGRAKNLFKYPKFTFKQNYNFFNLLLEEKDIEDMSRVINPNGSVLLNRNDICAHTSVQLNFENKDKEVRPLAYEKKDFVYIV